MFTKRKESVVISTYRDLRTINQYGNSSYVDRVEAIDLRRAQFMADKIGKTFLGTISGVTGFGFFVELQEVFVEGLVKISSIKDDYYIFIETEHRLIGQRRHRSFQIGDKVKVRVAAVDLGQKRIDLTVLP